jgi:Holliday junction resolvase RusA-like endonuclease
MIELHIPLRPIPWAPARVSHHRTYDIRSDDKKCARTFIRLQFQKPPIPDYTVIKFKFSFEPPKSATKKMRARMLSGEVIPTSCDCTNLQKLYEDCLKEIVIEDDRKVAKIFSEKLYEEKEGIFIKVLTLKEYNDANCTRED